MVKQRMRDRVRFEPKVSWLDILQREAGALWVLGRSGPSAGAHTALWL